MANRFIALDNDSGDDVCDATDHVGRSCIGHESSDVDATTVTRDQKESTSTFCTDETSPDIENALARLSLNSNKVPIAPPTRKSHRPRYDFYCIIDFECTCDNKMRHPHEIIEFPAVFLNAHNMEIAFEFHQYVRPTEQPHLSVFCTELTGITQEQVSGCKILEKVLEDFHVFCVEHSLVGRRSVEAGESSYCVATDGPWDVCRFLRPECDRKKIRLPSVWDTVCDVRSVYHNHFGVRGGISEMLAHAGWNFNGREHSGIDDARNIARLVARLLRDGADLKLNQPTARWKERGSRRWR